MFKRAIVTGASSGIGAAIATKLCLAGTEVIAVARHREKLLQVKSGLPASHRAYFKPVVGDISTPVGRASIIKAAQPISTVNLLVNNAGFGISKSFEKHSQAVINNIIATNLTGTLQLTHKVLAERSKQSQLQVVFVSSLAGKIGFPNLSVYSATKFALEGFAEALRCEYQDKNVTVSILRPGVTDTEFFKTAGMKQYYDAAKQSKQLHSAESVAQKLLKNAYKPIITVGGDKYFVKLLPFIPFNKRFQVLEITNKLEWG